MLLGHWRCGITAGATLHCAGFFACFPPPGFFAIDILLDGALVGGGLFGGLGKTVSFDVFGGHVGHFLCRNTAALTWLTKSGSMVLAEIHGISVSAADVVSDDGKISAI
jgi:hypothetical protein